MFDAVRFLITDLSQYHFHRPTDNDPASPLWNNNTSANVTNGFTYVNGALVNGLTYAMPTVNNNAFNIVEILTTGNVQADGFNRDRIYHAGDQSQAEVIIFDSLLNESRRLQIESYLVKKWFGTGSGVGNLLPTNTAVVISGGSTLDLRGENYQVVKSLSSSDGLGSKILLGAATLTIRGSGSASFDGVISGQGALVKDGPGTQSLTATNTYTGTTTVSNGVLELAATGAIGQNSNVTVCAGGTLSILGSAPTKTIDDGTRLTLIAGGMVQLAAGVNETVNELFIDGRPMWPGTWGSGSSPATYKMSGYFSGTGVITVLTGSECPDGTTYLFQ